MLNQTYKLGRLPLAARRWSSSKIPPTHFSNPSYVPPTFDQVKPQLSSDQAQGKQIPNGESVHDSILARHDRNEKSLRELTSLLAMCVLAYLAVDNYTSRIKLERASIETSAINLKALQVQQANFLNARKKRDIQILQERKDTEKRDFKMTLHIAILRKQLLDNGIEPIDVELATREFEKSVKIDNSMKNISGQALWLDDHSRKYSDHFLLGSL